MDDIFIIILLILLNGVFSMAEIALISARKSRLSSDAREGSRGAATALRLAEDPDKFLSTIQIGITLIGILTGLYSGAALAEDVGVLLQRTGLQPHTAKVTGQVVIVAVVTYLSIVVGELVPKRIGLSSANTVAKLLSRPMWVLSKIALPAVWLLSVSTSLIVKIFGLDKAENSVTEEEIKSLIQDGTDSGEVRKVEQDIMERALVLGDLRVSSIMTPKVDVSVFSLDMGAKDVRRMLAQELHSVYPVYADRSRSVIAGAVSLKRLIFTIGRDDFSLKNVVTEPQYFPEAMSVYDALDIMKEKKVSFAIVCDEFGDMAGVVTPSDILDGLVGEMPQQSAISDIIQKEADGSWAVDAQIQFYDFLKFFELEDLYHPAAYSTLGGFILEELRRIPAAGERLRWNSISFEIVAVSVARIEKVKVSIPDK